jgi:hypothetical protein
MAITYRVDSDAPVVLTTATGTLTDGDILAHKKALLEDASVHPGMAKLSDVRGVNELAVTPDGIRMFTSFDQSNDEGAGRLAIVASEDFTFGTARMYQMRGEDGKVGVFRSVEEARAWLGLPSAD